MYTPADIEKMVNETSASGYGVTCQFYKLDEKYGCKLYSKENVRDYNYALQKLASLWGYGPPCESRFSIKHYDDTYYGYLTGVAELAREDTFFKTNNPRHSCHEAWLNLGKIGILIGDNHSQNFGYYNGKPVAIDFGQPNAHVCYRSPKRAFPPQGFDFEGRSGFNELQKLGIIPPT